MSLDPFERFESSRRGLLIPVGLFIVGMFASAAAVSTIHEVDVQNSAEERRTDQRKTQPPVVPTSEPAVSDPSNSIAPQPTVEPISK